MPITTIDNTYFRGNLTIAQVTETSVANNLSWFIAKHSETFLRLLLGDDLYEAYKTGMAAGSPDPKWTTLNSRIFDTTNKISPVANYIYWFYQRHVATDTTGKGETIYSGNEGYRNVGSTVKVKLGWNEMVKMSNKVLSFVEDNADYPEYVKPVYVSFPEDDRLLYHERKNLVRSIIPFF